MNIKRTAALHQSVPNFDCLIGSDPDFVTEIARVTGARDFDRHASNSAFGHAKIFQVRDVAILHETLEQTSGSWTLQSKRGNAFGNVFDLDVHAGGVLCKPAQARI